jgi:thiamine biosynthesis lipoprotein
MGVTLNGIAQGFITDRVADMLHDMGFAQIVAALGEIRVLGQHPEGRPWRVGIKDPREPLRIARTLDAVDRAIATTGGYATQFDSRGKHHHIFDPATGESARRYLDVTVVTDRAMTADALSTATYIMARDPVAALLRAFPGTTATFTLPNGRLDELNA